MTDFGRRAGDMLKSVYDTDENGVVDDSTKLEASTKAQVRDHTPKSHTHTQSQITDLIHDALKIMGVVVDDTDKADTKGLYYNAATQKLEYETPPTGGLTLVDRGDPNAWDWQIGVLTLDGTYQDLDCSAIVPAGAVAIYMRVAIVCATAGFGLYFRKNGNTNGYNLVGQLCVIPTFKYGYSFIVFCDAGRVIEYSGAAGQFSGLDLLVTGWFI